MDVALLMKKLMSATWLQFAVLEAPWARWRPLDFRLMPELHAAVHDFHHVLEVCCATLATKGENLVIWNTLNIITQVVAQLVGEGRRLGI